MILKEEKKQNRNALISDTVIRISIESPKVPNLTLIGLYLFF